MATNRQRVCALPLFFLFHITLLVQAYTSISDDTLRALRRPGPSEFDIHTGSLLSPILIPRVPGTENSTKVLQFFTDYFSEHLPEWKIEYENSTSTTPTSNGVALPFRNFIAYRDPPWAEAGDTGRLSLVAHYDSKIEPHGFIGAVDSAAPIAMILQAVTTLDSSLTAKWAAMEAEGVDSFAGIEEHKGIQVILLDGEEAFLSWTGTDSLYGARSLAETWDNTPHAAMSTYKTRLESISLFLLLDLLGAPNPQIPSYFKTTHWAYQSLAKLEQRLRTSSLFNSHKSNPTSWFHDSQKSAHASEQSFPSYSMQDDHIPFMARGVQVLHLIPHNFPAVWHTINDDGEHLDMDTVEDWAVLITGFVGEWMELEGFMEMKPGVKVKRDGYEGEGEGLKWMDQVVSKTEL